MLKKLENRLAGIVEGTFSRAFRSEVRPVEIAHKLVREMDLHRSVSVSKTYVPHVYTVFLSEQDFDRFAGYQDVVSGELAGYLLEYVRRERLALLAKPAIDFRCDDRLGLGEFGIHTHPVQLPNRKEPEPAAGMQLYATGQEAPVRRAVPRQAAGASLLVEGHRHTVSPQGAVLGRSPECDIVVNDSNVSRRHAQVSAAGGSWVVKDLNSTNGVTVNGQPVVGTAPLKSGDQIELGGLPIAFELGRG